MLFFSKQFLYSHRDISNDNRFLTQLLWEEQWKEGEVVEYLYNNKSNR